MYTHDISERRQLHLASKLISWPTNQRSVAVMLFAVEKLNYTVKFLWEVFWSHVFSIIGKIGGSQASHKLASPKLIMLHTCYKWAVTPANWVLDFCWPQGTLAVILILENRKNFSCRGKSVCTQSYLGMMLTTKWCPQWSINERAILNQPKPDQCWPFASHIFLISMFMYVH